MKIIFIKLLFKLSENCPKGIQYMAKQSLESWLELCESGDSMLKGATCEDQGLPYLQVPTHKEHGCHLGRADLCSPGAVTQRFCLGRTAEHENKKFHTLQGKD